MKKKLMNFVLQLSDVEIEEQLENIFEWAKIYKDLLEKEKQRRQQYSTRDSSVEQSYNFNCDYEENAEEFDVDEDFEVSETIDYNLAQMINAKISLLSAEETESRLSKLQTVPLADLSGIEKAQLLYEIEACELHLYELVGPDSDEFICPSCGIVLEEGARFCGKCGYRI